VQSSVTVFAGAHYLLISLEYGEECEGSLGYSCLKMCCVFVSAGIC
jgi:hypothetical protein